MSGNNIGTRVMSAGAYSVAVSQPHSLFVRRHSWLFRPAGGCALLCDLLTQGL